MVARTGSVGAALAPTSDGVRPSYRYQSWHMSGRLIARDGGAFSYAAMFFRYASPNGVVLYPASLSVVDESSRRLFSERRTERAGLGLADAAFGRLAVRVGGWRLSESPALGGAPTFDLDAKLDGVALHVHGAARKPGFALRYAQTEHAGYSSIASSGTIAIDGRRLDVRGTAWLDHELSNAAPSADARVAQFRVQLDDGREMYIETSGTATMRVARRRAYFIERDGSVHALERTSYQFREGPGATWRSPHTRAVYPDLWALHVNDKTEFLSLEPVTYDQESLAHGDGLSSWDGSVDVFDVTPGSQGLRLGSGYVLMYGNLPERSKS